MLQIRGERGNRIESGVYLSRYFDARRTAAPSGADTAGLPPGHLHRPARRLPRARRPRRRGRQLRLPNCAAALGASSRTYISEATGAVSADSTVSVKGGNSWIGVERLGRPLPPGGCSCACTPAQLVCDSRSGPSHFQASLGWSRRPIPGPIRRSPPPTDSRGAQGSNTFLGFACGCLFWL